MVIVFLWVLVAVVVGLLAAKRGRGSGNWFVIACALSPVVGLVLLLSCDFIWGILKNRL